MNHRGTMPKTNNRDWLNKKTDELVSRKIWPLPRVQDQEECTRDAPFRQMMNRPSQLRSLALLRADHFAVFDETVDNNDPESFHCAMGSILCAVQYFGIMPLAGVRSESPKKLAFEIYSLRSAYAVAIMVMLFFTVVTSVGSALQIFRRDTVDGITYATNVIHKHIISFLGIVLFMWVAPRWISVQRDWRAMERFLDRDTHQTPRLHWKFSMITAAIMIAAVMEYILTVVNLTPREFWSSASNMTVVNALLHINENAYPYIFTICNYNLGIGIFFPAINVIGAFVENFTDIFIILVSEGLAERYKGLNRRVKDTIISYRRNVDWHHLRESYATLSTLVKTVDNNISPIILLSFVNNLWRACHQLFKGLSPHEDVLGTICFVESFGTLLGRIIAVTLLAARINDESRNALPDLYNCPSPAYNIDTQRLQQQLSTEHVSLTGMGFFSITRSFMLAVCSTIVTYEIMLLSARPE